MWWTQVVTCELPPFPTPSIMQVAAAALPLRATAPGETILGFESGCPPPATAEEYLLRVRAEAARLPLYTSCAPDAPPAPAAGTLDHSDDDNDEAGTRRDTHDGPSNDGSDGGGSVAAAPAAPSRAPAAAAPADAVAEPRDLDDAIVGFDDPRSVWRTRTRVMLCVPPDDSIVSVRSRIAPSPHRPPPRPHHPHCSAH